MTHLQTALRTLTIALLPVVTTACFFAFGVGTADISNNNGSVTVTPCFTDACADKVQITTLGDAENLLFSSSGRLFVSGGQNVVEISQNTAGNYTSTVVSASTCNFTGLAILQSTLYAACFDGSLWAGSLAQTPLQLSRIASLSGITAGNGLVDGPDGASLYLVNGPSGNTPKIVRIVINPQTPTQVSSVSDWLTSNLSFPNGLQRKGNLLYFTDSEANSLGLLKSVPILSGGTAGTVSTIASFSSLPDDFSFVENDFAVTFYSAGQIARINTSGQILQSTGMNRFDSPSQVRLSTGPLFRNGDLLVTEKGVIGENSSTVGNRLTLYKTR